MQRLFIIWVCIILVGCSTKATEGVRGASQVGSIDLRTKTIIDEMVEAMGGYKKWEAIPYISWTFFGSRDLLWDKHGNRVRIDSPRDSSIYLLNMDDMSGRVISHGMAVTDPDSLEKHLEVARRIWINDSYWLAMPFKLEDPGVHLQYSRMDTTLTGSLSDVIEVTFEEVGVTPQNKYEVYVDRRRHLITQWAFFREADQTAPTAIWPWDNYKLYMGVLISADRSDSRGPSDIQVFESRPEILFEEF